MRTRLLAAMLVILGTLAFTTLAHAQTVSNGPYYATPSWDQKLQCDTLATCPRFIVLSNWNSAAVLDRETGLVWERDPLHHVPGAMDPGARSWAGAQSYCNARTTGSRLGWRLPTLQELASLVDLSGVPFPGPTLSAGHPFTNVQSSAYWSATTAIFTANAWVVTFLNGVVSDGDKSGNLLPVWCVRGGQGVDPQ